jgi:hypothetical protein
VLFDDLLEAHHELLEVLRRHRRILDKGNRLVLVRRPEQKR